jgi:hypothetical protein
LKDENGLAVTVQPIDEYQKQSSWGRRLLITGGVCFLLGGIFFYSQLSGLSEIVDPNKNNEVNIGIGEQESVNLAQSCYVAWSENMSGDIEFVVYDSHSEVVNQSGCGYEFEAMDEKGTKFNRIGSWKLTEGTYDVHAICNSEVDGACSEGEVMLLDYDEVISEILGDYAFWLSCLVCMMGIVLLPVGGILHKMASRGQLKNRRTVMVVNENTGELQSYSVDNEGRLDVAGGLSSGAIGAANIAPGEGLTGGLDGEAADTEGLMTTEQIYLLMHGSEQDKVKVVERAFHQRSEKPQDDSGVPGPFVDSQFNDTGFTSSPFTIPDTKSSVSSKGVTEGIEGESGKAAVAVSKENDEKAGMARKDLWKDWDDG